METKSKAKGRTERSLSVDRKKHVCLIYEFLSEQGGLEREIINHANMLQEEGHEVRVLSCHVDRNFLKELPFDNINIESISKFNTRFEALNLILSFLGFNNIKKHNPHIFLSYSSPSNFLIKKHNSKKVNYVNHHPHFLYLRGREKIDWAFSTQGTKRKITLLLGILIGPVLKKWDKKLLERNHLNFINSNFTKRRLEEIYGPKFIVSYPPISPFFKPSKERINKRFIFSSSRIIPDKKYEWLIEAVSKMKNKLPLYLAGYVNEDYKKRLEELAKKKAVKLKFLGKLNTKTLRKYYTSAEVFAFPTPGEDFGLVPAESMACGTPVVVWGDGSGPTEQVVDGITGYHAKPYDKKDFAAKIDKVIDEGMKKKNRRKILENAERFSYKKIKKDFVARVNDILS